MSEILNGKGKPHTPGDIERLELAEIPSDEWQYMVVLPNGAIGDIRKTKTGWIVANPNGGSKAITSDTAGQLRQKYLENRLETQIAAQDAIADLAIDSQRAPNLFEGVKTVIKSQLELAQDIEKGRSSTEAARFAFQVAGIMPGKGDNNADDSGHITARIPIQAVIEAYQAMRDRQSVTIIDHEQGP